MANTMKMQMEYRSRLSDTLAVHRLFHMNNSEVLQFVLKQLGYEIHVTEKRKLLRLKRKGLWV